MEKLSEQPKYSSNISFIIPAYNCEETLDEAVSSICNGNISIGDEIIVVNDCSTDSTLEVANRLAKKFSFIKVFSHSENAGGAIARNTAVSNSSNQLIFCLDSDNVLVPNSINRLKNFLIEANVDIAAFQNLYYFTETIQDVTHQWSFKPGINTLADCFASEIVPISSGNYLYTRQSWVNAGGYPIGSRALDAWGFGMRQLEAGNKLGVLEGTGYFHRYGYSSYWVREQSKGDTSVLARQLIESILVKISDSSLAYMESEVGRRSWFENLRSHPIVLRELQVGSGGVVIDGGLERKKSFIDTLKNYIKRKAVG